MSWSITFDEDAEDRSQGRSAVTVTKLLKIFRILEDGSDDIANSIDFHEASVLGDRTNIHSVSHIVRSLRGSGKKLLLDVCFETDEIFMESKTLRHDEIAEFSKRTGLVKEIVIDIEPCEPETQTEIIEFMLRFLTGEGDTTQNGIEELVLINHSSHSLSIDKTEKICAALRSNKIINCPLKSLDIIDPFDIKGTFEMIVNSVVDHGGIVNLAMTFDLAGENHNDWRNSLTNLRDGCLGQTRLVTNNNGSGSNGNSSEAAGTTTAPVALKRFHLNKHHPLWRERQLFCHWMSELRVHEPLARDLAAIVASNHGSLKDIQIGYEFLSGLGREQLLAAVAERNSNLLSLDTLYGLDHRSYDREARVVRQRIREAGQGEGLDIDEAMQEAINQSLKLNRRYKLYAGNLLTAQRPSQLLGDGNEIPLVVLSYAFREFGETKLLLFRSYFFEALRSAPIGLLNSTHLRGDPA